MADHGDNDSVDPLSLIFRGRRRWVGQNNEREIKYCIHGGRSKNLRDPPRGVTSANPAGLSTFAERVRIAYLLITAAGHAIYCTRMCMPGIPEVITQYTAEIFMNNRIQAVRLRLVCYRASGAIASKKFTEGIEELPVQERELQMAECMSSALPAII